MLAALIENKGIFLYIIKKGYIIHKLYDKIKNALQKIEELLK